MNGVARWFGTRGEIPLVAPPGFREDVPVMDDAERQGVEFPDTSVEGVAFALEYCDLRGRVSTRTIRCLGLSIEQPAALKAFCRVRGEMRTFRIDRIISIADLRSGVFLSGQAHIDLLAPYLPNSPDPEIRTLRKLQAAARDGVFALLHLAMPDGILPAKARAIVLHYIDAESWESRCLVPHGDLVALWVDNLAPDSESVTGSIQRLLADKDRFARLLPWLLKIVRSQDSFAEQESSIRELIAAVRAHYGPAVPGQPAQVAIGASG